MNTAAEHPFVIDKDEVKNLIFPLDDVLSAQDDLRRRKMSLDRAMALGNLHHNKVKIIFRDASGLKMVETTIWAATDEQAVLKSGMSIPVRRIVEVVT